VTPSRFHCHWLGGTRGGRGVGELFVGHPDAENGRNCMALKMQWEKMNGFGEKEADFRRLRTLAEGIAGLNRSRVLFAPATGDDERSHSSEHPAFPSGIYSGRGNPDLGCC